MSEEPKLKPCPFCGIHAEMRVVPEQFTVVIKGGKPTLERQEPMIEIRCTQSWCGALIRGYGDQWAKNTIFAWNRRVEGGVA